MVSIPSISVKVRGQRTYTKWEKLMNIIKLNQKNWLNAWLKTIVEEYEKKSQSMNFLEKSKL